jgi:cytidylate kinase
MLKLFKGCVIDGRDIGSKVFKKAQIKLFIDVKVHIRAKRRHKQLIEIGEKSIYAQILKEIQLRDKLDKNRKYSPLIKPKGSITIDNSEDFKTTITAVNNALKKIK